MGYNKGYAFERSLRAKLNDRGFYVVRTAGSGVDGLSPDLIVLSTTRKFAIECKAIESAYLAIGVPKMERMMDWERVTGMPVFVAWKHNRKQPVFVPLSMFQKCEKNYTLRAEDAAFGLTIEEVIK